MTFPDRPTRFFLNLPLEGRFSLGGDQNQLIRD
jgi:hypothetical protein